MSKSTKERNVHEEARETVLRFVAGNSVSAFDLMNAYTCLMFSDKAVRGLDPERWSLEKIKQRIAEALRQTEVKVA